MSKAFGRPKNSDTWATHSLVTQHSHNTVESGLVIVICYCIVRDLSEMYQSIDFNIDCNISLLFPDSERSILLKRKPRRDPPRREAEQHSAGRARECEALRLRDQRPARRLQGQDSQRRLRGVHGREYFILRPHVTFYVFNVGYISHVRVYHKSSI